MVAFHRHPVAQTPRARVGIIYQQFNLVRRLRVLDNVLIGRLPHLTGWGRWTPVLEQLSKDLGLPVKQVAATDYRGSIEALKFNKAQIGQLGPKGYVEASNNNYAGPRGWWCVGRGLRQVDDATYQIIRDLNETTKRLAALK